MESLDKAGSAASMHESLSTTGFYLCPLRLSANGELLEWCRSHLGTPAAEERDQLLVKTVSPVPSEIAPRNTLSSRFGLGAFPFHTDTAYWRDPARYLVLWCESPGSARRATLLCDTRKWNLAEDERHILRNEVWIVRDTREPFLCSHYSATGVVRVDHQCMEPAAPGRSKARAIIKSHIARSAPLAVNWVEGLVLVIDNRRVLHARAHADEPDTDRRLRRVLVRAS